MKQSMGWIVVSTALIFCPRLALAQSAGQCRQVIFDCTVNPHRATIDGFLGTSPEALIIDCGKNTDKPGAQDAVTYSGTGNVGAAIQTTGNPVKGGLDITGIDGMGTCGGKMIGGMNHAAIIHTIPSGKNPTGKNTSQGCIHVSEAAMSYISSKCIQAKLQIKTSNKAAPPTSPCSAGGSGNSGPSDDILN